MSDPLALALLTLFVSMWVTIIYYIDYRIERLEWKLIDVVMTSINIASSHYNERLDEVKEVCSNANREG